MKELLFLLCLAAVWGFHPYMCLFHHCKSVAAKHNCYILLPGCSDASGNKHSCTQRLCLWSWMVFDHKYNRALIIHYVYQDPTCQTTKNYMCIYIAAELYIGWKNTHLIDDMCMCKFRIHSKYMQTVSITLRPVCHWYIGHWWVSYQRTSPVTKFCISTASNKHWG